jgi:hypothetical protein
MENKELKEFLNNSELAPKVFLGSKGRDLPKIPDTLPIPTNDPIPRKSLLLTKKHQTSVYF